MLTYPRTDSTALPEDYVAVVKQTMEMISTEDMPGPLRALAAHAKTALKEGYVKPNKRIFDNAKVVGPLRDHPDAAGAARACREIEAKLYDMVVKRFLAVFFPPAEFMVTTRISTVARRGQGAPVPDQRQGAWSSPAGWRSTAREAQEDDANLVAGGAGRDGAHRERRRRRR